MAKKSKTPSKGMGGKTTPLLKGQGKSLAAMKPEASGGFGTSKLAKSATNQNYGGKKK